MNGSFQKNYKALTLGGIITVTLAVMLNTWANFVVVSPTYFSRPIYIFINIFAFIFCWLVLSFLVNKFPVYKILGVLGLLIPAIAADHHMNVFNPITTSLMILFWLGLTYLILPQFFKKYKIAILSVYGIGLSYFFIFRMMPNYVEDYHQNFIYSIILPIPVFAALWIYEQWRWLKTLQVEKGKAELALLKSQINPHFFFNTLNNLYGLTVEKSDQAPEVVLKLSDMMRYTIYEGKEDFVTLKNEVEYLENYIELHKIRYQKKVDIRFTKEIESNYKVAPLLFIILLENAFKHGVEHLTEGAYIHLDLKAMNNQISFSIGNNFEQKKSNPPKGIGLENLKKRLTHMYPNQHTLTIEDNNAVYKAFLNIELV